MTPKSCKSTETEVAHRRYARLAHVGLWVWSPHCKQNPKTYRREISRWLSNRDLKTENNFFLLSEVLPFETQTVCS